MATTPNMNIQIPVVGVTDGPEWAEIINEAFETVDNHDHSPGNGQPVTPDGLNLNGNVNFQDNFEDNVGGVRLTQQGTVLATANDVRMLYSVGGDLYYNNEDGTDIKITDGAGLNASTIGGIGGDYGASDATLNYSELSKTFVFNQDVDERANIDVADVTIRDDATSANGITLKSPVALGSSYDMTLPTGLPVASQLVLLSPSGQISTSSPTSDLEVIAGSVEIKSNVVTRNELALTQKSVVGEVKMLWKTGLPLIIPRGWMYMNGATVNQATYDALHGAGAWTADNVAIAGMSGVILANLSNTYVIGSTTVGEWNTTLIGSNTANHTHSMAHVHAWYHQDTSSTGDTYENDGSRSNVRSDSSGGEIGILIGDNAGTYDPGSQSFLTLEGQGASSVFCYTSLPQVVSTGGDGNPDVQTSTALIDNRPLSIRMGYIIRVAN